MLKLLTFKEKGKDKFYGDLVSLDSETSNLRYDLIMSVDVVQFLLRINIL